MFNDKNNPLDEIYNKRLDTYQMRLIEYNKSIEKCDDILDELSEDKFVKQYLELLNKTSVKQYLKYMQIKNNYLKKIDKENNEIKDALKICCSHKFLLLREELNTSNKCYCLKCHEEMLLLKDFYTIIDIGRLPSEKDIKNIQEYYNELIKYNFSQEEIIEKIESTFTSSKQR